MGCLRYVWWKRRIGRKDKDGKCVYDSKSWWNGLERVEGDRAPYSSGISHIINSVCKGEVAMETPLTSPILRFPWWRGPSLVTLGLPRTHSIAHCWVAARMLGILQRPSCHSHITFPWEQTLVARCEVAMETAHGQVAENKWGDVRVSRRRLKRPVLYLQRRVCLSCTYTDAARLSRANAVTDSRTHIWSMPSIWRSLEQLGHSITRSPVWHVPRSHAIITARWNGDLQSHGWSQHSAPCWTEERKFTGIIYSRRVLFNFLIITCRLTRKWDVCVILLMLRFWCFMHWFILLHNAFFQNIHDPRILFRTSTIRI